MTKKQSGSKTSKPKLQSTAAKSISQKYQKKDLHQHILDAPDTYIGSIDDKVCNMWIYNESCDEADAKMIFKEITYVPGFYKICDEIFVNAADHSTRCKACNKIKIDIDQKTGKITVWNNGDGIDVVEHPEHKILVPSMLFCDLLTSTNYDKTEKKTVGGKNGFGAKLANIYSVEFIVETLDATRDKLFKQKCTSNMYNTEKASIKPANGKEPYTKISFVPDFKKFGLEGITDDMMGLLKKRAYDMAMTTNAKIYFNGKIIAQNTFDKYIGLYFPSDADHKKVIDTGAHKRWKVCAVYDRSDLLEHQNISFVNSICTSRGGTHVDQIVNQVVRRLSDIVTKKVKDIVIKPSMIKENLLFFVDATIVNPDFDTQTKECLTTKPAKFGSTFEVTDTFIKKIIKTGVVDQIIENAKAKAEAAYNKDSKEKGPIRFEKLYGAHKAGTKEGHLCTLILTEGDSAKTFAMSGLNVIGRDYYGVFPLRGKLLNVRDASKDQLDKNAEIIAIRRIMGLERGKAYDSVNGLRYGSIMVLADSDVDGYHIKGLVMNYIHFYWPTLIRQEGFLQSFATPLMKASKGKGKTRQVIEFMNAQECEEWKAENNNGKGWTIKYYKGLGTHTAEEAQECFADMDDKLVKYFWEKQAKNSKSVSKTDPKTKTANSKVLSDFIDDTDIVSDKAKSKSKSLDKCEDAMLLAFRKDMADERKEWVGNYNPENYLDSNQKRVSYYDFVYKELITFTVEANTRSIPNIMDGFKPSQRKVYYGSLHEKIYTEEIKVSELAGAVSKVTKYHHGEASMVGTIIGMAQNYVGSNNINILLPEGQFGSRLCGGKDHASARYIHTKLNALGKSIFNVLDYDILQHQTEDNKEIEPMFYAPVFPMILVNGTEGIGMGYSTCIPPCNPHDIYANIKRIMNGDKPKAMYPWYRNSNSRIEKIDASKFVSRAQYEINGDTIHITDLPIGVWTDNYKAFLDKLLDDAAEKKAIDKKVGLAAAKAKGSKGSKTKGKRATKSSKFLAKKSKNSVTAKVAKTNPIGSSIKTYKEDCTEIRIDFTIIFHPGKLNKFVKDGTLEKHLKLVETINLTNMHLFDNEGKIRKYDTYGAILKNFADVRLELYQLRKDFLLGKWQKEMDMLKWKLKFVEAVINEEIIIFKKKAAEIIEQLSNKKFPMFSTGENTKASYDYLTSTSILKFSKDHVEKLRKDIADKKEEIGTLKGKTPIQLWDEELDIFMDDYEKWKTECEEEYKNLLREKKGSKKLTGKKSRGKGGKAGKATKKTDTE